MTSPLRAASLAAVLAHPAVWRGGDCAPEPAAIPTGFAVLDAVLPGGGWPLALTEIQLACEGIGELRLVLPGLARLQADNRDVVWIAPPHQPYAPALAAAGLDLRRLVIVRPATTVDAQWAFEQALRAPGCAAAFLWLQGTLDERAARRLQVAARDGGSWGVLWRRPGQHGTAVAAPLRLALAPVAPGLAVRVVKRRGGEIAQPVLIDPDRPGGNLIAATRVPDRMVRVSATGRPEREHRSAQREGGPASATGRPEREHRSVQREGGPVGTQ